jgi:type VI secretion system secreted protein Hcp
MKNLSVVMLRILGLGAMAILICVGTARAQGAFIKINGVPGTSTDDKHKDWIEIHSFQWGAVQQRAEAEKAGRAPNREALVITKEWDAASPKMKEMCATGTHFPALDIDVVSGGKTIHYHLTDVTVSSFSTSGGERPSESISLNFTKITMNY